MIEETVNLGKVCEILDTLRKPITKKFRKQGQYPYYGATGIVDYVNDYIFDETLVLIGEDGAKWDKGDQTAFIVSGKYWVNNHAHVIRPFKDKLNQKFLVYYLNSIDLKPWVTGLTVPKLNQEKLKSIPIPLPSIEKQENIVAKLDEAFDEINKTINFIKNKEQEVNALNEIILLNEFKLSLETKKLSEVCKIYNGGTPDTKNKLYWGGKNQWLTPRDMGKLSNEHVDVTLRQLTDEGLKNSSANLVPKNSVILSCRAPIGHLAINNVPMAFNQGCKGLVPNPILLNRYFYYFFLSSKKLLNNLGTGTTFKEISSKVLSSVEINVPSLDMQKKIINKFDLIFRDLKILKDINKKQIKNYISLGNAIIGKEITSKAS